MRFADSDQRLARAAVHPTLKSARNCRTRWETPLKNGRPQVDQATASADEGAKFIHLGQSWRTPSALDRPVRPPRCHDRRRTLENTRIADETDESRQAWLRQTDGHHAVDSPIQPLTSHGVLWEGADVSRSCRVKPKLKCPLPRFPFPSGGHGPAAVRSVPTHTRTGSPPRTIPGGGRRGCDLRSLRSLRSRPRRPPPANPATAAKEPERGHFYFGLTRFRC